MTDAGPEAEEQIQADEVITYRLDHRDTIVEVSQTWNHFALSNNATEKTLAKAVIGCTVFSFILGDPTRMYFQALLQQARILGRSLARNYRCDSPELKRYMEMRLTPEPEGIVRLDHTIQRVEPLKPSLSFQPASRVTSETIGRCSVCARLTTGLRWVQPEEVLKQGQFPRDGAIPVRYLVCPDCVTSSLKASSLA